MNDLETIEDYLNGRLPAEERTRFETVLRTDPAVADALAFYVLAKHTAKADAREQRRAELDALRREPAPQLVAASLTQNRPEVAWSVPMRWVAAASVVLLLGLGYYFFQTATGSISPPVGQVAGDATRLADDYIATNFDQLSTIMSGGTADQLAQGIDQFNHRQFDKADATFQKVLTQQPDNDRALRFAGIVALRRGNYDQAIDRFHRLSQFPGLFSNPGTFYEALAHLKRGRPMDKSQAKKLLEEVINKNLEGKKEAERLLSNF